MLTHPSGRLGLRMMAVAVHGAALLLAIGIITTGGSPALAQPEHLIIAPADFLPAFETLAAHRTQAGIPSVVVALEDVFASAPPGRDDAETLRNYLIEQHASGALRYVLLGGDSGFVPVRTARSYFYPPGEFSDLATDLYYACLDGDWDGNGNDIFGEAFRSSTDPGDDADFDTELAIGRAPVSTVAQAERFVAGILAYDNATDATHFGSALLMAEVLFPSDWNGGPINVDGAVYAEVVRDQLLLHPSAVQSTRLYENSGAYPGSQTLTLAAATAALESGFHGTLYHIGLGNLHNLSMGDGLLGLAEVDALANAPQYSVTTVFTSNGARFTEDCILEHFVTAPSGGSAAAVGFADVVFPNTAQLFSGQFFIEITAATGVTLGDAVTGVLDTYVANTFFETSTRWTSLTMVLLGDPAMPYRGESAPVPTSTMSFGEFKSRFEP